MDPNKARILRKRGRKHKNKNETKEMETEMRKMGGIYSLNIVIFSLAPFLAQDENNSTLWHVFTYEPPSSVFACSVQSAKHTRLSQ